MSWLSLPEFEPAPENAGLPDPFTERQRLAMAADLERAIVSAESEKELTDATVMIVATWAARAARLYSSCWRHHDLEQAKERDANVVSALDEIAKRLAALEARESVAESHEKRLYRLEQSLDLEIRRRGGTH